MTPPEDDQQNQTEQQAEMANYTAGVEGQDFTADDNQTPTTEEDQK